MTYSCGPTVTALSSPGCTPASVSKVTPALAARSPVFIRYSRMVEAPAPAPVPANHMSEPGCVQLTTPMPEASDCSASKPSAIWPVAATAVPPKLVAVGAVTTVSVPGADTVAVWAAAAGMVDFPAGVAVPGWPGAGRGPRSAPPFRVSSRRRCYRLWRPRTAQAWRSSRCARCPRPARAAGKSG